MQNTLRVTCSNDCTLAVLDVLYVEHSMPPEGRVIGQPRLPLTILLAGRGTFESPFYLGALI